METENKLRPAFDLKFQTPESVVNVPSSRELFGDGPKLDPIAASRFFPPPRKANALIAFWFARKISRRHPPATRASRIFQRKYNIGLIATTRTKTSRHADKGQRGQ